MKWDKNILERIINEIKDKIQVEKDELQLYFLMLDYSNLMYILEKIDPILFNKLDNFIIDKNSDWDNNKIIEEQIINSKVFNYKFLEEKRKFIKELAFLISKKNIVKPKIKNFNSPLVHGLNKDEYDEVLNYFYKNNYSKIYNYLKNGFINFSDNVTLKSKCGYTICLNTINESFINIDFPYFRNITTLPHEIAHIIDFYNYQNSLDRFKYKISCFKETNPKLTELLFLSELKKLDYNNLYFIHSYNFFDSIKYMADISLDDLNTNCIDSEIINEFLTSVLSVYLFHLNKYNKEKLDNCNLYNDEIFNIFNENEIFSAYQKELISFNEESSYQRRKKMIFKL